ncbi:MAG: PH domain-containing protein [Methanotrichaceae archaeon]
MSFLEAIFGIKELGAGDHRLADPEAIYQEIMKGTNVSILLKRGERGLLEMGNITLKEPRSVRRGAYGGPSFRVCRGVSFRLGGFQAESHQEIRAIDNGSLCLTSKRLIFSGSKKNTTIPLKKIIRLESGNGALMVQREDREKSQQFSGLGDYAAPVERAIRCLFP